MNQLRTTALLAALTGLLITVSYWLGGSSGIVLGVGLAAVMNLGSWYFSDRVALAVYRARPVSEAEAPSLYQMVRQLCQRAQMPIPQLYVIPSQAANAFATGRDPEHAAVAVTQGIMSMLPADELEAVVAHELSHIYNRDTLTQAIVATIAGAIGFAATMVRYSFFFFGWGRSNDGPNPLALLVTAIVAPIAATLIQMGISRTREFAADAGSARLTGNPRALARALQRLDHAARQVPLGSNPAFEPLLIMHPFSGESFTNLFSTHPSTEARIERLLSRERGQ